MKISATFGLQTLLKASPRPPAGAVGLPGYAWDQRMASGRGRYINLATGRIVPQKEIENVLRGVIDISEQAMREFGRMAAQGEMTPQQFYEAMRQTTRLTLNAAAALAKGGWQQMTPADWGRNGWLLRQQYQHLAAFTADLPTAQTPAGARGKLTPEQAQARALLYSDPAWARYWELEDQKQTHSHPATLSKIQTIGDDRVCPLCLAEQALGYRPLSATPALPLHPACRCKKRYRRPQPADADSTKHYGPGNHPNNSPQSVHGHSGSVSAPVDDEPPGAPTTSGDTDAGGDAETEATRQKIAKVHGRYAPALAHLKAEKDKWQQLEDKAMKTFKSATDKYEVRVGTEEYERRRDEIVRLRRLKEEADRKWRVLHEHELSKILPLLVVEDPMTLQVEYLSHFDAARKQAIAEGVDAFQRLTSRALLPAGAKPVADFKLGGKRRSTYDDGIVRVAIKANGVTVAHEMGHWLEAVSPAIHERCVKFYEERTQGWPLQKLRAVTRNPKYKPGEVTRVDKFINPYMGREYMQGDRRFATEILSMGIEHFADGPGELATGDPEYFRFIYDLLRGR